MLFWFSFEEGLGLGFAAPAQIYLCLHPSQNIGVCQGILAGHAVLVNGVITPPAVLFETIKVVMAVLGKWEWFVWRWPRCNDWHASFGWSWGWGKACWGWHTEWSCCCLGMYQHFITLCTVSASAPAPALPSHTGCVWYLDLICAFTRRSGWVVFGRN